MDVKISQDTPRWKLFEALGVSSCSSQKVVNSILRRYDPPVGVTLRHSIDHLKYLFWVGSGKILDKRIFVMDQMERRVYRGFVMFGVHIIRDDVYFATDGEYSTKKLSQKLRCRSNQQNSFPVEIYIIHDACLGALPPSACSHGLTWERWLQVTANVRRVPKLFDPFQDRLFPLGQHFSDYHPTTVIGSLKTYWSNYNREMTSNIIRVLECMLVPGRYTQERSPLCRQYYPSNQLLDLCSRAGVTDNFAHFLQVPVDLVTDTSDEWEFLSTFRVGLRPDIRFFRFIFSSLTADQTIKGCLGCMKSSRFASPLMLML